MIKEDYMDDETVINFVKAVFSIIQYKDPQQVHYPADLKKLLKQFRHNQRYMQIVRERNHMAMLELIRIALQYPPDVEDQRKGRVPKEFSDSFLRIVDYQEKIVGLYYHILEEMKLSPSLRFDIAISYATYMYYHLDFHRCYQYLNELHEEYGGQDKAYKINFFFGQLHEADFDDNPYYHLVFALKHYQAALYLAEQAAGEHVEESEILSILEPMAQV